MRDGRCGCLVSVCVAYRKIAVPKFPLTLRRTPPPARLLRVTVYGADSAPARAPSTLVRWRIGHLHIAIGKYCMGGPCLRPHVCRIDNMNGQAQGPPLQFFVHSVCWMRFCTHTNGARAGALLAPQAVTRRCVAGGDVQPLQSLQFRDYSLKTYNRTARIRLNVPPRTSGVLRGQTVSKV